MEEYNMAKKRLIKQLMDEDDASEVVVIRPAAETAEMTAMGEMAEHDAEACDCPCHKESSGVMLEKVEEKEPDSEY